jgi:hypothetical protein
MSIADYKNPHDRFFREIFGRPEMVLDFVKEYLMVKIWETYLKQHKRARKLPFIIPMVIYHGRAAHGTVIA